MKKYRLVIGAVALCSLVLGASLLYYYQQIAAEVPLLKITHTPLSGGETTVFEVSRDAFARPLANLPTRELRKFTFGNKMFNTNWVQAPASVTSLDGLGPTFNRVSCSGCHFKDGRGRPPLTKEEPMLSMLVRLSIQGEAQDGGPLPHPAYGLQLNNFAIGGVESEGQVSIEYEEIEGKFADGTPYQLRRPVYHFYDMAFGALSEETLFSPRVAPAVHGMGLLEAVPEETIRSIADQQKKDKKGISGRVNMVSGPKGKKMVGRFGWKANVATIEQQVSKAALGDIGITSELEPEENCPAAQTSCREALSGGQPEMSAMQLERLIFYNQTLAPPARRDVTDQEVQKGAELFIKAQCASCHQPKMTTGKHIIPQLAYQEIQPFTDLLIHDMGPGLADHRPDYQANGREWRTPPLWGIGLVNVVNGHSNFLHDGRARNLTEAILWHGGEAENAKNNFVTMNAKERQALLRFLNSL